MGVVLWHKLSLGGIVVTNDVYGGGYALEAGAEVRYALGEAPSFTLELHDLPLADVKSLAEKLETSPQGPEGGIPVTIELGYFDGGPRGKVLEGRIDRLESTVRERPLVTTFSGHDVAGHRLLSTTVVGGVPTPPGGLTSEDPATVSALVQKLSLAANVPIDGEVTSSPSDLTFPSFADDRANALELLEQLAERASAEWCVQDGKLAFGTAIQSPMPGKVPVIPDPTAILALLGREDTLVAIASMSPARLARLTPLTIGKPPQRRVATDRPEHKAVQAFDFVALGAPGLRAGQLVSASVKGYETPFKEFRILAVTHRYSPREGYTCTGRAAEMAETRELNRQHTREARDATAASIATRIADRGRQDQTLRPSIDVGRVRSSKSAQRAASLHYRQEPKPGQASPSIDADISEANAVLVDKPLAAPFAWHKVGLSVPVYKGMRALLAQVRDVREDAIVTGFLWANQSSMERPDSRDGDWWLCLPTELDGNGLPTGKGVNDLTSADGLRVVEAKGLLLKVGDTLLSPVGARPTEGDANVLEVQHKSGATVRITSDGAITVQAASGQTLTLGDGATKVEIGGGKVSISGGTVSVT